MRSVVQHEIPQPPKNHNVGPLRVPMSSVLGAGEARRCTLIIEGTLSCEKFRWLIQGTHTVCSTLCFEKFCLRRQLPWFESKNERGALPVSCS